MHAHELLKRGSVWVVKKALATDTADCTTVSQVGFSSRHKWNKDILLRYFLLDAHTDVVPSNFEFDSKDDGAKKYLASHIKNLHVIKEYFLNSMIQVFKTNCAVVFFFNLLNYLSFLCPLRELHNEKKVNAIYVL